MRRACAPARGGVLGRLVTEVQAEASDRLPSTVATAVETPLQRRLDGLLVVPEASRSSEIGFAGRPRGRRVRRWCGRWIVPRLCPRSPL